MADNNVSGDPNNAVDLSNWPWTILQGAAGIPNPAKALTQPNLGNWTVGSLLPPDITNGQPLIPHNEPAWQDANFMPVPPAHNINQWQDAPQTVTNNSAASSGATAIPGNLQPLSGYSNPTAATSQSALSDGAGQSRYDGLCQLPDGSIHPYVDAGGGYANVLDGGNLNTDGQAGIGAAARIISAPTLAKPGGIAGGGKSGDATSPASSVARDITGGVRFKPPQPLTGTASVGGSIARAIPYLGTALMLGDFYSHDTAPVCLPVPDPTKIY